MCLKFVFQILLFFGLSSATALGQKDTLLYFDGLIPNSGIDSFPFKNENWPESDFLIRPFPSDTSINVVCFYPILILGTDQVDSEYHFSTDQELNISKLYRFTIELGLYSLDGYYPDSIGIWVLSDNIYDKKAEEILRLPLENLCDNKIHRIVENFSIPFKSSSLLLGGIIRAEPKKTNKSFNELFENIIFCSDVKSLQDISLGGDKPLMFIRQILITDLE